MRNKKADLSYKTLAEVLLFVVFFLVIIAPACTKIINFFTGKPESGTTRAFQNILLSVNHLSLGEKVIPVYIDERHAIFGFNKADTKPQACLQQGNDPEKSCICLCWHDTPCEQKTFDCKSLDKDYFISPGFTIPPTGEIQSYVLTLVREDPPAGQTKPRYTVSIHRYSPIESG
ncbi:hypothetical protein JW930_00075 [Candidatus Woesearchaeota archaeon]|nr:hypothetical protein [Candidatus Woesearchaeota archaeon]